VKNKKLFAILTLVCFMFTLMPVAAFAAIDEQDSYVFINDDEVRVDKDIEMDLKLDVATNAAIYVWFEETGYEDVAVKAVAPGTAVRGVTVVEEDDCFLKVTPAAATQDINFNAQISRAGEFKVHAAAVKPTNIADFTAELRTQAGYDVVTVASTAADSADYVLKALSNVTGELVNNVPKTYAEDGDVMTMTAADSNGIEAVTVGFKVYEDNTVGAATVYADDIEIDTTSGVTVTKLEVKRSGDVSFNVIANKAGTHKVYITIGDFKATIKVDATEGVAETIEVYELAKTPVNIDTANLVGLGSSLVIKIYDENGNELTDDDGLDANSVSMGYDRTVNNGSYPNYVSIIEQPKGADLENEDVVLVRTTTDAAASDMGRGTYKLSTVADAWTIDLVPGVDFEEEGTYTFKVALNDGTSTTASIRIMEAGDPVALSLSYDTDSVQLGASISPKALGWLDKNYVFTSNDGTIKFTASGAAIKDVTGTKITVKDDEKYVGSEIVITVVDEENNLVATKTLTVAAEAKELVFDTTAIPVDQTRTVTVKLVDEDGNSVSLSDVTTTDAYVVVMDRPVDSDVLVSDTKVVDKAKGLFTFTISADKVGVVKLQAVLKATSAGANEVVRYYTGVGEIKVGATGIEDTVVMSIGANKIVVNDEVVAIDAAPMIKDSRTFVPFRALAEAFGAVVEFDAATQAVVAELDGTKVVMTIGSEVYTVNGVAKTADVAPFISDSRTMVPVRFAAEAFGITVTPIYAEDGSVADVLFTK